jgi:hypothetical protein
MFVISLKISLIRLEGEKCIDSGEDEETEHTLFVLYCFLQ